MLVWQILIVVLLVVLNGFFAMSELAVVSARRARLQQMADSGSRGARSALRLIEDPTRFLSSVQIGITLVGIFAGAYSGATLSEPFAEWLRTMPVVGRSADTIALAVVVVSITYLSLIVGELVPKRIAMNNAEGIAAFVAPTMTIVAKIAAPVVWFLGVSTKVTLKLIGVKPSPASTVTEEEVKTMIAEGTEAGIFKKAEQEMIDGVMRLADRSVRSIMTPRHDVVWLDPSDPMEAVRQEIADAGHSRYPVSKGELDDVVGIIHTKDILDRRLSGEEFDLAASARQPLTVHESMPVLRLMELFRSSPVHMAVVLDEYGGIEGIVTPTDVLTAIAGALPEGEEDGAPEVVAREDGSWLVDGRLAIDAVERLLGRRGMSDDDDYTTLAGFVLWQLGHVPKAGEHFTWEGLRFEVVDMDARRIDKVLISPPSAQEN
ncbi:hemolysin family protein [Inquilinus sp. CAU 1745]|uniref:hemolysin family protein n=1 Tax=Inquilinus sp. CAU 1745 TaxID=3140369 RepID=UPI00325B0521